MPRSINDHDPHFHDLRGTATKRFYVAGLLEQVIAEIMAWKEGHVAKIVRRNVDRSAATRTIIKQLNERGTKIAKPAAKPYATEFMTQRMHGFHIQLPQASLDAMMNYIPTKSGTRTKHPAALSYDQTAAFIETLRRHDRK